MTPNNEKDLEQLIHRELRALPPRRAPRSLEHRVLAAIEQRAAVAWYHRSWAYWPAPVRAVFLGFATAIAGSLIAVGAIFLTGVDGSEVSAHAAARLSFLVNVYHVAMWAVDLGSRMLRGIPPLWLYGGLGVLAALYASFFGLGAAAYRTLVRSR